MGILHFFLSKGEEVVVQQTAKNAALGYKKLNQEGSIPANWEDSSEEQIHQSVLAIAVLCQSTKPTSPEKKAKIFEGLKQMKRKTLINYTCLCILHEYKDASGRSPDDWVPWLRIINEELINGAVPKELRLGWGLNTDDWVRLNFFQLYQELHFYRNTD